MASQKRRSTIFPIAFLHLQVSKNECQKFSLCVLTPNAIMKHMANKPTPKGKIDSVRVRAAPSPTGRVHIGNVRTFLYNYLFSRRNNGSYVLRIEDTDQKRKVEGGMEAIIEAMGLFGITFDESPEVGGEYGPYVQSDRLEIYKERAEELVSKGAAYYCFCSSDRLEKVRKQMQDNGQRPMYDKKCRSISIEDARERIKKGEKYVVRLKVPDEGETVYEDVVFGKIKTQNKDIDDQVLLKSDGFPTYHLAVTVDDHLMKISHIMRATEWMSSTPKHVLLYDAFGWKPPIYAHVPMILNPDGKGKLSKRKGALPAISYLRKGYLKEAVLNYFALIGWAPAQEFARQDEIYTIDELIKYFDLDRIHKSGGRYDQKKFDAINGKHIRLMSTEELADRVFDWAENLVLAEFISDKYDEHPNWEVELKEKVKKYLPKWKKDKEFFIKALELVHERLVYLGELPDLLNFFFEEELEYKDADFAKMKYDNLGDTLVGLWQKLEPIIQKSWNHETWEKTIRDYADEKDWKHGDMFMLLRLAVTGGPVSPPLFECMELMGLDKCDKFVNDALKYLKASKF